MFLVLNVNTYNLSALVGIPLGTAVRPRCEQSTVVPEQTHDLGHLVFSPNE